tara:strand:+ start:15 stop:428 length:414 start_codon:yes stop_codon:yes gene_type:complete
MLIKIFLRKIKFFFLLIFFYIFLFFSANALANPLQGRWIGNFEDSKLIFEFKKKYCSIKIVQNDENIEVYEGQYEVDFKKKPIPLNIIKIKNYTGGFYTIIEFSDEEHIIMSKLSNSKRIRPIEINKINGIFLTKVK